MNFSWKTMQRDKVQNLCASILIQYPFHTNYCNLRKKKIMKNYHLSSN